MSTIQTRVERDADMFDEEQRQLDVRRRQKLNYHVGDLVQNMKNRWRVNQPIHHQTPYEWLKMKTFSETFIDYSPEGKQERTTWLFSEFLRMAHGDEKLFLEVYTECLNQYFPVEDQRYGWAPKLTRSYRKRRKGMELHIEMRHQRFRRPIHIDTSIP